MPELSAKPSIIFITIDCLRADHVGCLGYRSGITPTIDRLAGESLLFSKAIVAGSPTYNSFPALLAGRFPLAYGRDLLGIGSQETTLASCLKAQGYRTGAIVAGNPYAGRWMGYDRGFDYFEDFLRGGGPDARFKPPAARKEKHNTLLQSLNRKIEQTSRRLKILRAAYDKLYFSYSIWVAGRRNGGDYYALLDFHPQASLVTDKAITWLEGVTAPFFLWLHYMDAHRPYCPPPSALEQIGRSDISPKKMFKLRNLWVRNKLFDKSVLSSREDYMAVYDACVASIDRQLGRLLEALGTLGIQDNCLIVLTADHGEVFLEHGERDHDPVLATQTLINIPLLIRAHRSRQITKRITFPFSHIDLLPTILDLGGLVCPPTFTGRSRWAALRDGKSWQEPAITEMVYGYDVTPKGRYSTTGQRLLAATSDQYKMVINIAKGSVELFDLKTDPMEQHPQAPSVNPSASRQLLKTLNNHLERTIQGRHSMTEMAMRLDKIKQLLASYYH